MSIYSFIKSQMNKRNAKTMSQEWLQGPCQQGQR